MNMQQNVFKQFDELFSRWSMIDKVEKDFQLQGMWQQLSATYNYIMQVWQSRGYLNADEYNYANQIYQMLVGLQNEKMKIDQELTNEMVKYLVKMRAKQL